MRSTSLGSAGTCTLLVFPERPFLYKALSNLCLSRTSLLTPLHPASCFRLRLSVLNFFTISCFFLTSALISSTYLSKTFRSFSFIWLVMSKSFFYEQTMDTLRCKSGYMSSNDICFCIMVLRLLLVGFMLFRWDERVVSYDSWLALSCEPLRAEIGTLFCCSYSFATLSVKLCSVGYLTLRVRLPVS